MDKTTNDYRNYDNANNKVIQLYKLNHTYQTVDFVKSQINKYCINFDKFKMTIWEAIDKLDNIIDESDPDLDLPQIIHALQTSERLKQLYPNTEWISLIGILHDLGKIIALPEIGQEQWATVGDTFPVGCKFSDKIVYYEFFKNNADFSHPIYSTKYGMYNKNCGLDNLLFSFGHDEYMYQVLKHNNCLLPEDGLKIIRYHSFYPWHKENEYTYFMNKDDEHIKDLCKIFSKADLYSKDNLNIPNTEVLIDSYKESLDKYFPDKILDW